MTGTGKWRVTGNSEGGGRGDVKRQKEKEKNYEVKLEYPGDGGRVRSGW